MNDASIQDDAASALRRAKNLATAVLAGSVVLLVVARLMAGLWPVMAYVAAFAEAAMIGGLADWYAVVALFGRPLGLPLPHTAIIPRNRDRIAERLGTFIQDNFLQATVIDRHLAGIDFAGTAITWLRDPANAVAISRHLVGFAPALLTSIDRSGLRAELGDRIVGRLSTIDMARLASGILRSPLVASNRQRLLDAALGGVIRLLSSPKTLGDLREGLRGETPALVKLAGADQAIFRKIVLAIAGFVEEVRQDPQHGLRQDFDTLLDAVASDLDEPETQAQLGRLRDEILASPEIAQLGETIWNAVRRFVDERPQAVADSLADDLAAGLSRAASAFDLAPAERATINDEIRRMAVQAIAHRRQDIGAFVSAQVRSWDIDDMVRLVEQNIGPDLQYIRLNGALVGGLAGLAIFIVLRAFG